MVKNNRVYDIQIKKWRIKMESLWWTIPGTDRLLVWSDEESLTSTDCCQRRQYFWVDDRLQKEHFQSDKEPLSPPCVREIMFSLTIPNVPTTATGPSRRVPSTYCRLLRLYLIKKGNKNIWFFSMAHHIHVSKASQSRKGVTNEGGPFELFYIV